MSDLAKFTGQGDYQPDIPFDVELAGPDGEPLTNDDGTTMTIGVLGEDSEIAVAERNLRANRRISGNGRTKVTAESLEADGASYLAKLSTRWNITMGEQQPPFTEAAARALYSDRKLAFIRAQIDKAIAERANFLKR